MTSTPAVDNFYQAQVCQLGCKPALGWASRKASSRPPFGMLLNTGHLDEEERAVYTEYLASGYLAPKFVRVKHPDPNMTWIKREKSWRRLLEPPL
ncbi:hypothetical protein Y1Q_0003804 [Alligator mississippiensis]|uniref:Uncharacterized protein n=1 Tax=Alligator mississippiensis TaxID=8496 RepID=A0A151MNS2_ALLMI|nr:hypothetical protein Y1Q_0003804 [Alligator mississippiensis]